MVNPALPAVWSLLQMQGAWAGWAMVPPIIAIYVVVFNISSVQKYFCKLYDISIIICPIAIA